MVDIASLKGLLANRPSLVDYLGGGKSNIFDGLGQANAVTAILDAKNNADSASGDSVSLSAEAQKILSQDNNDGSASPELSGVQKGAQDFFMSFFDQSGVDLSNISGSTLELIKGFQDVIAQSGTTTRDISTDLLEEKSQNGQRKAYTLVGQGVRLRIAIDYKNGQPDKLSITDIDNGQVDIADITFDGTAASAQTLTLHRAHREYVQGNLVDSDTKMPMTLDLYAA